MKHIRLFNSLILLTASALLLLSGCNKAFDPVGAGSITVEASIGTMTKVTTDGVVSSFEEGDKIAVYAWTGSAAAVPAERVVDGVVNTLGGDGKWTPASQMRWKVGTDAHYFLGVSPVRAVSDFTADAVTLSGDYAKDDLLFAKRLEGLTPGTTPVALTFEHAMAMLTVNLKVRNEFGASPAVSVSVSAKSGATVNYLTQAVAATGTASERSLTAAASAPTGYTHSFIGIQVPQEGVRTITITVAGQNYIYEAGEDIPLTSGHHTTLGLIVGKDKIELFGVSVKDWETDALADGNALPTFLLTPLTLETVDASATMNVTFSSTLSSAREFQYSLDGGESWNTMTVAAGKPRYTDQSLTPHEKEPATVVITDVRQILLKAANESYGERSSIGLENPVGDFDRNLRISVDTDCYIYGNMMSLVGGDQFATRTDLKEDRTFEGMFTENAHLKSHPDKKLALPATTLTARCYRQLFYRCTALTIAPDLPAKVLTDRCYSLMFHDCSALTATPALPATTLAVFCYYGMFSNCMALTSASELPAPTLAAYCYQEMFRGCTSLTEAPELLAVEAAKYSCESMFKDCSALKTAPSNLAATVADHCYEFMFESCMFLESAPELPAMTMAPYCYAAMFRDCPSLETAPALPATTLANNCYDSMFYNYSGVPYYKLKNAPALPATTLADYCYASMFRGCTALTKAPDLPAKELKSGCYVSMFYNCSSLNYLKCLATSIASDVTVSSPTFDWVSNVPENGTFVKDASVAYGSGEFWDTSDRFGSTTNCAAFFLKQWTVSNAE